jgi:hypothetical protein
MSNDNETPMQRRRFIKLVSTGAMLAPFAGLAACSGGEEPAEPRPEEPAAARPEPSGELPRLEESDPQARSLAYVNDASKVDPAAQPRYEPGQECANCALYLGGDEWGGCSIFPGKLVNANGWCSVYAPKA